VLAIGQYGAPMSFPAEQSALDTADELLRQSEDVIGSNVVAVILHGSLVSKDFVANKSDIDLLVIVGDRLADEDKRMLGDGVTWIAQRRRAWVDYRVVTSAAAVQPVRMPTLDFYVGVHPDLRMGVEIVHGPAGEPDLLFEFAICREEGRSLVGPAATELIGAVPNQWLLDVGDAYLKRWQEIDYDERDAELMVLTACRLWYRYAEGSHCTKSAAATWVMGRAPELRAPQRALERRTNDPNVDISEADVRTLLAEVRRVLAVRT
jgi:hypothetical protein